MDLNDGMPMQGIIDIFSVPVELLISDVFDQLAEAAQQEVVEVYEALVQAGADKKVANIISYAEHSVHLLNVVWALKDTTGKSEQFAKVYFKLGSVCALDWLREKIDQHSVDSIWMQISKAVLLSDINRYHREIAQHVFQQIKSYRRVPSDEVLTKVLLQYDNAYQVWSETIEQFQATKKLDFSMFNVALLRLDGLIKALRLSYIT
jgi:NAD-specific glutamate dehydrogenase